MARHLSPHFTLEEFVVSETAARKGINNTPYDAALLNLHRLAETMEKVRAILNNQPVLITSGYRSPGLNKAIGGSKNSAHMNGLAADFICPGFGSPLAVCREIHAHAVAVDYDQLIYEFDEWVHLGLTAGKPRHQTLTIDSKGTRFGFATPTGL